MELSQKSKELLKANKLWREEKTEGGKFITLSAGTTRTLLFDINDMEIQEVEFKEKKVKRVKYGVYDVTNRSVDKQYFSAGKVASGAIDSNLEEGNIVLKITRTGEMFDTKYTVVATQLPSDYNSPL